MSYSFNIRAASKAAALAAIAAKLDDVVKQHACHEVDRTQAQQTADLFVGMLPDDDSRDVNVSVSGYVSGTWNGGALMTLGGVSCSVAAALIDRAPAAQA